MDKARVKRIDWLVIGLLALVTLAVYWQVHSFEFVNFDDDVYVENNPAVLAGLNSQTIRWALTANYQATWQPLVWLSLMADSDVARWGSWLADLDLGKKNAGYFHLTNVALHLANTLLLFLVLSRITGSRWRSAFVAALFAIHPLHVESVAWVTERKDVLSSLFWMLAMLFYADYARTRSVRPYLLVVAAFVFGLMSKPMLVTLPLALMLLDYWPLRRYSRADGEPDFGLRSLPASLREKSPLFALAAVACVVAFWAQRSGGAIASVEAYPLGVRFANALVSCATYIWKMFLPAGLAVLYPHPGTSLPVWQVVTSGAAVAAVTVLAIRSSRSRPYVAVGWFWYLVTLLPVIGIVQFGKHAMADRFTYIPLIGIFIIIAWGAPDLLARLLKTVTSDRKVSVPLGAVAVLAIAALTAAAHAQVGYWRDSVTLFGHAIRVTRANSLAHNNLGSALLERGEAEQAVRQFRLALKHHPEYLDADYNLGNALYECDDVDGAVRQFRKVIRIAPKHTKARNNLGSILAQQGRFAEAVEQFEEVLRLIPDDPSALRNLESAQSAQSGDQ